ncbi:MAG: C40 family peptidase [Cytophagales bacterium]|nr:C40 family peptidase [Cytophagales bacterium]MDW8384919.1 C40 family peptidase [Flammeovirgaceae bacterium]
MRIAILLIGISISSSMLSCQSTGPVYKSSKNSQIIKREIRFFTSNAVYGKKNQLTGKTTAKTSPLQDSVKEIPIHEEKSSKKNSSPALQQHSMPSSDDVLIQEQKIVLEKARSYIGTRHKLGGMDFSGIDCSGLMVVSFREIGLELPRTSREQAEIGKEVNKQQLQLCDLVFFTYPGGNNRITHVGMISKITKQDILFIHASTSAGVREESLFSDYWNTYFVKAKRIL